MKQNQVNQNEQKGRNYNMNTMWHIYNYNRANLLPTEMGAVEASENADPTEVVKLFERSNPVYSGMGSTMKALNYDLMI